MNEIITLSKSEIAKSITASTIERPSFLLCPPFSHATTQPNNAWMLEYTDEARRIERRKSIVQFLDLYNFLAADALVYLLPTPANSGLQDQVFTANLGFVPEHLPGRDVAIIANFTSVPRIGETPYGVRFFEAMGYRAQVSPHRFEGEAEIKHLHGNIYVGGYGVRSDRRAYTWMEENFDMRVIAVEETDTYLYHLDCSVFPLSARETIVCTAMFNSAEVAEIERETAVIDVSTEIAYNGICNSVRFHNLALNASNIHDLKAGTDEYAQEIAKNRALEDICAARGLEPVFFNLSEYMKSGALLSCLVMHLNRHSYRFALV